MNNIEILEEFIDKQKSNKGTFVPTDFEITALENLIQENKELKEHLKKYYNGELFTAKQLKSIEENQKKYFVNKSKIKELAKKYEFAINGYDSSTADYKQSQDIGRYIAYVELLKGE
jgi:hypothetical protein